MNYEFTSRVQKVKFMREAASIRRCHTFPIIGDYNVGFHTFNMIAMLRLYRPDAPLELVWAIVDHDIPERLLGDIPSPAKGQLIDRELFELREAEICERLFNDYGSALTVEDQKWFVGLDLLELYLFCQDQFSLGNRNCLTMIRRIDSYVNQNRHKWPAELLELKVQVDNFDWIQLPDLGGQ